MRPRPRVSMLVPFSGDAVRAPAWRWLERKWRTLWPELEIVVSDGDGRKPFSKPLAVNAAAARATGDVFAITDADVYMSVRDLRRHADRVFAREVPWMLPWARYVCFTQERSEQVLTMTPREPLTVSDDMHDITERGAWQTPPGSLQLVPREAFELVGGYDERYRGWGGDDYSFLLAVDTMFGRHERGDGLLVSMWHPRAQSAKGHWLWDGQEEGTHKTLERRYRAAWHNPRAMRALLEEARAASGAAISHRPASSRLSVVVRG